LPKKAADNSFAATIKNEIANQLTGGLTKKVGREMIQSPRVDIIETGEEYLLQFALPGLTQDELDVRIENDKLVVEQKKKKGRAKSTKGLLVQESIQGRYYRDFPLTDEINREAVTGKLELGILTITLHKSEKA
jgi:HSP20 family protein